MEWAALLSVKCIYIHSLMQLQPDWTHCIAASTLLCLQTALKELWVYLRWKRVTESYKLCCEFPLVVSQPAVHVGYILLHERNASTWGIRASAEIKGCICDLLLQYQKLSDTGFNQLAVNPWSDGPKSAFIHFLELAWLKTLLKWCVTFFTTVRPCC